jgi:hypothetical protein
MKMEETREAAEPASCPSSSKDDVPTGWNRTDAAKHGSVSAADSGVVDRYARSHVAYNTHMIKAEDPRNIKENCKEADAFERQQRCCIVRDYDYIRK